MTPARFYLGTQTTVISMSPRCAGPYGRGCSQTSRGPTICAPSKNISASTKRDCLDCVRFVRTKHTVINYVSRVAVSPGPFWLAGHIAIARCRCGLRLSPRLSRRKPSSTSVSPRRARSSPLSVSLGYAGQHREYAANEPVRSAEDDRHQSDTREDQGSKPVTAPSFVVFPASDRFRVAVAAQKRRNAGVRRSAD